MAKIYHGGALDLAIAQYGSLADAWLDLSTGINPHHYPIHSTSLSSWTQLPQNSMMVELTEAASEAYNCSSQHIIAANGTQSLIEKLPEIFEKSTIAILSPTYEEHAHNWKKHGHNVIVTDDLERAKNADHLLIVNPNNPTGKLFSPQEMRELGAYFAAKNGYLIIDEAFMDLTPDMSMANVAGEDGFVILRSFGKFFGLAGVRIGFMLAPSNLLEDMQKHIGLWNIAGMAMDVATLALNDTLWQKTMRQTLALEMQDMSRILTKNGFNIVGSTDLFCLATMPNAEISAHKYFDKLARNHILTRKFIDNESVLRFGLIKNKQLGEFSQKLEQVCEVLKP